MEYKKVYVGMVLYTDADGNSKPVEIEWINGARYPILKVLDKRNAPAHVGSTPTVRYTVLVQGREKVLYYEKFFNKWFIEKKI